MQNPALDELYAALRAMWVEAGAPPLRKVRRNIAGTGGKTSLTTVHAALYGSGERLPRWESVSQLAIALGGDVVLLRRLWAAARASGIAGRRLSQPPSHAEMQPAAAADLAGGQGPEYRVTGGMSGHGSMHEVCELTAESGLQVRLGGLLRWQALAIVAILHHPYED